jgi:DeoR/GlpR family transcriptional regulator of sugar metabolism
MTSSCRQKILKELSRVKTVHVMGLVRNINSTYVEVNRNLKLLEKEGVVIDQRIGRMRMLRLNHENPKTKLLLQALKILNTQTKTKSNLENTCLPQLK